MAFNEISKLDSHMKSHATDLKCQFCGRNFYTKVALNLHLNSHKLNGTNIVPKTEIVSLIPTPYFQEAQSLQLNKLQVKHHLQMLLCIRVFFIFSIQNRCVKWTTRCKMWLIMTVHDKKGEASTITLFGKVPYWV